MKMIKRKKTVFTAIIALVLCVAMLLSTVASFATGSEKGLIGAKKAKQIALKDAKLKESDVVFVKAKLDKDDGKKVYEVEFYRNNKEYDYEIDAKSGKILSRDFDIENYSIPKAGKTAAVPVAPKVNAPKKPKAGGPIDIEKAKQIALSHAELKAKDVVFGKAKQDTDDGVKVYEIEFYSANKEYDYEIDRTTGEIRSWSIDEEDRDND